jgi:hypothetical protein
MIATAQTVANPYPIVVTPRSASALAASPDKLDMRGKNVRPNATGMALLRRTRLIGTE